MKNKYYTPSIEEFHVGFEYEEKNNKEYRKINYDGSQVLKSKSYYDDHGCEYDAIEDDLKLPNYIRVKYLDKEDIESCGCRFIAEEVVFGIGDIYKYDLLLLNAHYKITHIPSDNSRLIIKREGINIDLIIRNKSELKALLKQLNIK